MLCWMEGWRTLMSQKLLWNPGGNISYSLAEQKNGTTVCKRGTREFSPIFNNSSAFSSSFLFPIPRSHPLTKKWKFHIKSHSRANEIGSSAVSHMRKYKVFIFSSHLHLQNGGSLNCQWVRPKSKANKRKLKEIYKRRNWGDPDPWLTLCEIVEYLYFFLISTLQNGRPPELSMGLTKIKSR